ncbi:MAG: glycosyltransferase [Opitutales bacterium]|nr:glycosyltransferase [Opitutales bacterium]MDP4776865.1 glycosyltransferase [Opitutales bacterium]MDP4882911.1 glycosyltransferase [Opitutales bacterium]MDP5079618.1 glycosyltransferase [Opitutales bacterium]
MHCLIIGKVWPEPSSTAAGRRTLDILSALQAAGWTLSFASTAQSGPHSLDLAAMGIESHTIQVNDSGFDTWLKALAPDVVIFDRFMTEEQFGWRVEQVCPQALRVLDTSDLHCLREARHQQLKTGKALDLFNEIALREIASIHRSDQTLMISEYEMQLLRDVFSIPETQIAYWPFGLDRSPKTFPAYAERQHFIMIGSFHHAPNLDAARWCKQVVWPLIRKAIPEAELHCYGSYGDKYAGELNAPKQGFLFKGRADDALATMQQYRVNLAPLRFGAGLKGKLFDGFETGTPSVTTPVGAEGIATADCEWGCDVSDEPEAIAKVAVQLYQDEAQWSAVQAQGQRIADTRFDAADWLPRLPQTLSDAFDALDANRQAHFVGQMLRHHQHRSTEFMSRWIEAKNVKRS